MYFASICINITWLIYCLPWVKVWIHHTHTHTHAHNRFTALFPGPPRWAGAIEENFWTLWCKGRLTEADNTDHPAGRHSIWTKQCPPPPSPHFFQPGCASCRPTNSVKAPKATRATGYTTARQKKTFLPSITYTEDPGQQTVIKRHAWLEFSDDLGSSRFVSVNHGEGWIPQNFECGAR